MIRNISLWAVFEYRSKINRHLLKRSSPCAISGNKFRFQRFQVRFDLIYNMRWSIVMLQNHHRASRWIEAVWLSLTGLVCRAPVVVLAAYNILIPLNTGHDLRTVHVLTIPWFSALWVTNLFFVHSNNLHMSLHWVLHAICIFEYFLYFTIMLVFQQQNKSSWNVGTTRDTFFH